jgi:NitT/TauT family transport system substrate-binding protein
MKRCIALLLGIAVSTASGIAAAQTKLTLGFVPANPFMPAFVAKDQGFFAKRGLDVTLQMIQNGSVAPPALMSNELQVATLTPPLFLLANEGGIEMQIVAGAVVQERSNPTTAVVAREGAGIKVAADFRGKKIGVPGLNGVQHIAFMKWLQIKGLDPKQASYVEVNFPQMGDLLKARQIDAALPIQPFLDRIAAEKSGYSVAQFTAEIAPKYLEAFYAMSKSYVQKNPKEVRAFRDAIAEGLAWLKKNEAAARNTQVSYLKLPEKLAATIQLPAYEVNVTQEEVQFWVDLCRNFGITKGTVGAAQVLFR